MPSFWSSNSSLVSPWYSASTPANKKPICSKNLFRSQAYYDNINDIQSSTSLSSFSQVSNIRTDLNEASKLPLLSWSFPVKTQSRPSCHGNKSIGLHDFEIVKPLAKGQYGKVYIVKSRLDEQIYCMKVQDKQHSNKHSDRVFLHEERSILSLQHPRLPQLYASFQDSERDYLVMEYMSGGDLFSLLDRQANLCLTEQQAQFYMAEMILSCQALHQLGYLHRDIKPQNILLDRDGHVKLADFGSSILISQATKMAQAMPIGTCDYVSPEVLETNQRDTTYGTEVDCWSLGICLYEMLQELPPFYSNISENDTYRKILFHTGSVSFNENIPISNNAKDIINRLLTERENRASLEQIKSHPFFDGIDWDHIFQSTPPFQPVLHCADDTSNFSIPKNELPTSIFTFEDHPHDNSNDDYDEDEYDDGASALSQPLTPPSSPPLIASHYHNISSSMYSLTS